MVNLKIKAAFKKMYGISLEKYHSIIEQKFEQKRSEQIKKLEYQIEQILSKW